MLAATTTARVLPMMAFARIVTPTVLLAVGYLHLPSPCLVLLTIGQAIIAAVAVDKVAVVAGEGVLATETAKIRPA